MCIRFILLLTVAIIAAQAEKISPATITSDATKLAKSIRTYFESLPGSMIKDLEKTRCPWMLKCCPEELAHFFPLMTKKTFAKNCIASAGSKTTGSGSTTCKQAIEEFSRSTEPNYADLSSALNFTPVDFYAIDTWLKMINEVFTLKELQAFYCESSSLETYRPYIQKALQEIAQKTDDETYIITVKNLFNEFTTFMAKYRESSLTV